MFLKLHGGQGGGDFSKENYTEFYIPPFVRIWCDFLLNVLRILQSSARQYNACDCTPHPSSVSVALMCTPVAFQSQSSIKCQSHPSHTLHSSVVESWQFPLLRVQQAAIAANVLGALAMCLRASFTSPKILLMTVLSQGRGSLNPFQNLKPSLPQRASMCNCSR